MSKTIIETTEFKTPVCTCTFEKM